MGIRIHPADIGKELQARFRRMPGVIIDGMNRGAMEGQAILVKRTPRLTGATAAQWRVIKGSAGAKRPPELTNDAPHAGVLEAGARPHPVSAEGVASIARWARLRMGVTAEEAMDIAHRIAWKLRKKGFKPTYFVRDSRGDLAAAVARGVNYELSQFAKKRAGRAGK